MIWLNGQSLCWQGPLVFASRFIKEEMALLFSGMAEAGSGHESFLFTDPIEIMEGSDWSAMMAGVAALSQDERDWPDWVGYLGYALRDAKYKPAFRLPLPAFRLVRYRYFFHFDHRTLQLTAYSRDGSIRTIPEPLAISRTRPTPAGPLQSNFTRARYETSVRDTIARIEAGDFYQANITRKFYGEFLAPPDSWVLFEALCKASPAPYSAYLRHGDTSILSASPECFLTIDEVGRIVTRPIKGSARRVADVEEDLRIRETLRISAKNTAENLMIVDLMRNDLARVSVPKSVTVTEQAGLYSYHTIHHLISTIEAQRASNISTRGVVEACFPPGSMTGAPKIAAVAWCEHQEQSERGVYSGAIGWFGAQGACDLSVVIRTLVIVGNQFEFQVGGGIVADSTPEDEWQETLTKARGIVNALGLTEEDLAAL